jgi:hypothetical protein
MQIKSYARYLILSAIFLCPAAMAERIKHLPEAPTWEYGVSGTATAGAVGSDYCDMDHGEGCQGVNVLITGQAAEVIFHQLPAQSGTTLRKSRGIECIKDSANGQAKCLFHVANGGIGAGETPWISD